MPSRYLRFVEALAKVLSVLFAGLLAFALIGPQAVVSSAWAAQVSTETDGAAETPTTETIHGCARLVYHFVPEDEIAAHQSAPVPNFSDYNDEKTCVAYGETWEENGALFVRANAFPASLSTDASQATLRVLKDYASSGERGEGMQDLSYEASYDPETGLIALPSSHIYDDLTIVWYLPTYEREQSLDLPIVVEKTLRGIGSHTEITHGFSADDQIVNLHLFDDEEDSALIKEIEVVQGGKSLTSYTYQNGSISIVASPLGGPIFIRLSDGSEATTPVSDHEVRVNDSAPRFSFFSAANPAVGERFNLAAGSAFIRTCASNNNMAQLAGWPSKDHTYGFVVHFNSCPNPEVVNADQNHVASGGMYHNTYGDSIDYGWIKGMHFAWGDCYGDVDSNGGGEPVVQSGWVEVTGVDYGTQTVSYSYFLDVCASTDGHNMQSIVGTFQVHEDLIGYLEINKESALPLISNENTCYSLAGAQYGIYADEACTELKDMITTDDQGSARSRALEVGTYYARELVAPKGYALDPDSHEIDVRAGVTSELALSDLPQSDPTPTLIGKHDSIMPYRGDHNGVQGGATTLEGAQFNVSFYPTLAQDYSSVSPSRNWTFQTDEHGIVNLRNGAGCLVQGDELFFDSHGFITLPLGTYVITETKAPTGYNRDETVYVKTVTGDATSEESISSFSPPLVPNEVIRGGIEIEKRDIESQLLTPLGSASLDGAVFTITNDNANQVMVGGILFQPGEVCKYLAIVDGQAKTDTTALPFGHYSLREVASGEGYNLNEQVWEFSIAQEGQMVSFSEAGNGTGSAIKNRVKRGDINFIKVREDDGARLAEIPFRITSKTTGESHVVLTDKNGIIDTSSDWIPHTRATNKNDSDEHDPESGVWFGLTREGTSTSPDDEFGALPYDTYTLEEIPCEANEGLELVRTEFSIYRDQQRLDFGVVENHLPEEPWLATVATDGIEHDKLIYAASDSRINDHVRYGNLLPGQPYTLEATLVNTETGEVIDGVLGKTDFVPTSSTGTTEVSIPANLLDQNAENVVVYETLIKDDQVILEHHELDNTEQTIAVALPLIGSQAFDASDYDHELENKTTASIVDIVRYQNLVPDEQYELRGTLMLKQTNSEGIVQVAELAQNGNTISGEAIFTPAEREGSIDVSFDFDASRLDPGSEVVVFERLYHDGIEVASHCDSEDVLQTVKIAEPSKPAENPDPTVALSERITGNFDKTASSLLPWFALSGILCTGALLLLYFSYRQRKIAQAVTAAIAQSMFEPKGRQR